MAYREYGLSEQPLLLCRSLNLNRTKFALLRFQIPVPRVRDLREQSLSMYHLPLIPQS